MRRVYLSFVLIAAMPLTGVCVWWNSAGRAQQAAPAVESVRQPMPLSRLVLFNSGVVYCQRDGIVDGDTRVDLSFPLTDINDLLKSLVVEDGDKQASVSYDGADTADRTLHAFALNLTSNPTFGQILNQSRGEKIEIAQDGAGAGLPATMTGVIVGMEAGSENGAGEVHHLNLLCPEGMRRVPLARIQRIRFLNPTMDDEFRRALAVLSASHNNQRRSLSIHLKGEGKRTVKIGYVVESPIWKASYRLVLDGKDKKPKLQGWAVIENTSDEDWKDVRMVLVSGRPITYQMDLSQPLFVPRPTVEPEVFASLRPERHEGPLTGGALGALGGALGALGGGAIGAIGGGLGAIGGSGASGAQLGGFGGIGRGGKAGSAMPGSFLNRYQIDAAVTAPTPRLTWEEWQERRAEQAQLRKQARESASKLGRSIVGDDDSIESIALDADRIGEEFEYTLKQKVSLARQKSALLPVLSEGVAVRRMSIYNKSIHPRFPLHGVMLKNTTGQHLMQGPMAVFDGSTFVGDTRLTDLQPGQERLLSYAMDLGVEIRDEAQAATESLVGIGIEKGVVRSRTRLRQGTTYTIRNRSKSDRSLIVEHPIAPGWTLVDTDIPIEKSPELYRFAWTVPAGKTVRQSVAESAIRTTSFEVEGADAAFLRGLISQAGVSKTVKAVIEKVIDRRATLESSRREGARLSVAISELETEQARLRANLEKLPNGSAVHKRSLDKFDQLETHIEKLQVMLREQRTTEQKLLKEYLEFAKSLNIK